VLSNVVNLAIIHLVVPALLLKERRKEAKKEKEAQKITIHKKCPDNRHFSQRHNWSRLFLI